MDVFHTQQKGAEPRLLARVPTTPRARTSLYIPALNLLAVAAPHTTNGPAAILLYQTKP